VGDEDKPWVVKGVDTDTRRKVKVYAAQYDITMAQALEELVEYAIAMKAGRQPRPTARQLIQRVNPLGIDSTGMAGDFPSVGDTSGPRAAGTKRNPAREAERIGALRRSGGDVDRARGNK
jgi:hypothetical protein